MLGAAKNLTPSVHTIILRDDRPAAPEPPEPARYAILFAAHRESRKWSFRKRQACHTGQNVTLSLRQVQATARHYLYFGRINRHHKNQIES